MKSIKKSIVLLLVVLMVMSLLTGCGKAANTADTGKTAAKAEKKAKDTITVLVQAEPQTLDPANTNNENIGLIKQFIFETLVTIKPDGKLSDVLAESHQIIDPTTVKFKLRKGVKYSDGTALTSKDVFFDIKRLQESPISKSHFTFIDLEKSTIEDDLNFTLKFKQPWAPFENTFSSNRGGIYSQAAFEKVGGAEKFARNPIGTGPYKLVKWVSGTQIELTRNEYYWGEPAKTKNVIIKFIAEPTARVIELETGAADIAYYIQGTDIKRVEDIKGYHVSKGDSYRYFLFLFSMAEPLLQDVRVREAMTLAIDKAALVKSSTDGVGTPINGYIPPAVAGYMDMKPMGFDVAKAKALLAEAGYPKGFEIELHVEPQPLYQRIAEVVQAMWAEIGIKANIVVSPLATYEAQKNGKFQVSMRDGTANEVSNVLIIYESTFGSRFNGSDKWLDAKLLELRTYYYGDPKREACLKEIYDYIYAKRYSYPFMVMPTVYGVNDKLEGFEFHASPAYLDVKKWVVYE